MGKVMLILPVFWDEISHNNVSPPKEKKIANSY